MSRNESSAQYTIKKQIIKLLLKYDHKYKNRTKLLIKKFKLYIKQGCPNCLKCTKKKQNVNKQKL